MKMRIIRSVLVPVTMMLACLAGAQSGQAAITTSHHPVTPSMSRVVCSSTHAWLRLWGVPETCYTGNGVLLVRLPWVHREQIIGHHTVCLGVAGVPRWNCARGPANINIFPPRFVLEIIIR
jgi:hypothetical protein